MHMLARLARPVLVAVISALASPVAGAAEPVVEVVTVGPGCSIDARLGHSLLRIADAGADEIYDFGVAAVRPAAFSAEAAMGRARLSLRRDPAPARLQGYAREDRRIGSQRLNLSEQQFADLITRLESNLLPANAEYAYDDVFDNGSTRLRDLLDAVTGGAVQRAAYETSVAHSYRDEILAAGSGRIPALIGYDLFTGPAGEYEVRAWQLSFAPERLRGVLAAAENPALGDGVPLVASEELLGRAPEARPVGGSVGVGRGILAVVGAALGLFFGGIGFAAWRMRRTIPWLSRLAGLALIPVAVVFGLLGFALLPISLLSTATIWADNQNAWIFFPLDLVLLGPAFRWVRSGDATFASWSRIYIDLRFLMIAIGWAGAVASQENSAFGIAAAATLAGLRAQPLRET